MNPLNIRQKLHQFVDSGDDRLIKLMYAVAREYTGEDDFEYTFSEEELQVFEDRRQKRLKGESNSYSWEEVKAKITNKEEPK